MSMKKPIIKVTKKCYECNGTGKIGVYGNVVCYECKGLRVITINNKSPNFKKYYIKNLEEVLNYWTTAYRSEMNICQQYLKKINKYAKELDKIINN